LRQFLLPADNTHNDSWNSNQHKQTGPDQWIMAEPRLFIAKRKYATISGSACATTSTIYAIFYSTLTGAYFHKQPNMPFI